MVYAFQIRKVQFQSVKGRRIGGGGADKNFIIICAHMEYAFQIRKVQFQSVKGRRMGGAQIIFL